MTTDTERAPVGEGRGGCECAACKVTPHTSDCAVHNEPAMPAGPCDCGAPSGVPEPRRPLGGALAMRVMQSDLYRTLDDTERAECDELVQQNLDWFKGTCGVLGTQGDKA